MLNIGGLSFTSKRTTTTSSLTPQTTAVCRTGNQRVLRDLSRSSAAACLQLAYRTNNKRDFISNSSIINRPFLQSGLTNLCVGVWWSLLLQNRTGRTGSVRLHPRRRLWLWPGGFGYLWRCLQTRTQSTRPADTNTLIIELRSASGFKFRLACAVKSQELFFAHVFQCQKWRAKWKRWGLQD